MDGYARRRLVAWIAAAVLIALHLWAPGFDASTLLWGVLPWELAFHVAWMVAAAALIHWITRNAWRDHDDEGSAP